MPPGAAKKYTVDAVEVHELLPASSYLQGPERIKVGALKLSAGGLASAWWYDIPRPCRFSGSSFLSWGPKHQPLVPL